MGFLANCLSYIPHDKLLSTTTLRPRRAIPPIRVSEHELRISHRRPTFDGPLGLEIARCRGRLQSWARTPALPGPPQLTSKQAVATRRPIIPGREIASPGSASPFSFQAQSRPTHPDRRRQTGSAGADLSTYLSSTVLLLCLSNTGRVDLESHRLLK